MKHSSVQKPLLAGVIGSPILHSKSPKLHSFWLNKYKINGHYIPIHVEITELQDKIQSLIKLGFRGLNVTLPHKTAVLSIADTITDRASVIGAANTLYFNLDGKITADNTDGYGFKQNIYHHYPEWEPVAGPAVVLGAGGAAKAVLYTLLSEGVPKIKLLNRTKAKALALAENFGNKVEVLDWYAVDDALKASHMVVNTTSLGMIGQPDLQLNLKNLAKSALVCDLIYTPLETTILKTSRNLGYRTVDGLGMLLYQAELGFSNWFNIKPDIDIQLRQFMINDVDD